MSIERESGRALLEAAMSGDEFALSQFGDLLADLGIEGKARDNLLSIAEIAASQVDARNSLARMLQDDKCIDLLIRRIKGRRTNHRRRMLYTMSVFLIREKPNLTPDDASYIRTHMDAASMDAGQCFVQGQDVLYIPEEGDGPSSNCLGMMDVCNVGTFAGGASARHIHAHGIISHFAPLLEPKFEKAKLSLLARTTDSHSRLLVVSGFAHM